MPKTGPSEKTRRGVSDEVRAEVKARAHGWCELFCQFPTPGNQIVHPTGKGHPGHQGIGGAASNAECNQARYLLWGCQRCQDLTHSEYTMARIDLDAGVLEFVDYERRKVPHERIFFHMRPYWLEAMKRYPDLTQAIVTFNAAGLRVAELLAWFAPDKGKPPLHYVCEELRQTSNGSEMDALTPVQDFQRLYSYLGMTRARGEELRKLGQWIEEEKLADVVRGVDLDALDALRSLPQEEQVELLGLWERPADFWDAVDKARLKKRKRSFVVEELDGSLRQVKSIEKPELLEGEALMRGTVVVGAGRLRDSDEGGEDE